jgi:Peptidase family M23
LLQISMKNFLILMVTTVSVPIIVTGLLEVQNTMESSLQSKVKAADNICGTTNDGGKVCNKGVNLDCLGYGATMPNVRFIPDNPSLYYALITIRCPEFGGEKENSDDGDRDSCGPYQQRVSEFMPPSNNQMAKKAKILLGQEYEKIFTPERINFIKVENIKSEKVSGVVKYGPKMMSVCRDLNEKGGVGFYEQIQIARFKDSRNTAWSGSFFEYVSNTNFNTITPADKETFIHNLYLSHGPMYMDPWKAKARIALNRFLNNDEYAKIKSACESEKIGCEVADIFHYPTTGTYNCNFDLVKARCYFSDYSNNGNLVHHGIDIGNPTDGAAVYAVADGVVQSTGEGCISGNRGCNREKGNFVILNHASKNLEVTTMYIHLLKVEKGIQKGLEVKRGQVIGYMGNTGNSTGTHLHFEINSTTEKVNYGYFGTKGKVFDPCNTPFSFKCPELAGSFKL